MSTFLNIFKISALIIVFTSLIESVYSQTPSSEINYFGCSSTYCLVCSSQYQCKDCIWDNQPVCCPRFCSKCIDMNHCIQCQMYFKPKTVNNSIVCIRINSTTDIQANKTGANGVCNNGYYLENVTNSCLTCNIQNCMNCSAYQSCISCSPGFYLWISYSTASYNQSTTFSSLKCLPCMVNCMTCTIPSQCINCSIGYFPRLNSCQQCQIQFCLSCSNETTCSGCITEAYMLYNTSTCILCESKLNNCIQCAYNNKSSNAILVCQNCTEGFYLNNQSVCTACPINCIHCSYNTTIHEVVCFNCTDDYTFNNKTGGCISCTVGCYQCQWFDQTSTPNLPVTNCTACQDGYDMIFNNIYNSSQNNYSQFSTCVPCQFPCLVCYDDPSGASLCAICYSGFYVNNLTISYGQCLYCNLTNCLECNSSTVCTTCEDGFYLAFAQSDGSQFCVSCQENCAVCELKISNTSKSLSTANTVICLECIPNYMLSTDKKTCRKCNRVSNCIFCDVSVNCTQCIPGYTVVANVNSSYTCSSCNSIAQCSYCYLTGDPDDTTTVCTDCFQGYYLSSNNLTCISCPLNCIQCKNSSACLLCIQGYFLATITSSCSPCPPQCLTCNASGCLYCASGYYAVPFRIDPSNPINVQCLPCDLSSGCLECFSTAFCRLCTKQSYWMIPTVYGNCSSCPDGCAECDQGLICDTCQDGYLLNKGTNTCLDIAGLPIWGIFVIITFGSALIFVVSLKVCSYIKKRRLSKLQGMIQTGDSQNRSQRHISKDQEQNGKTKINFG